MKILVCLSTVGLGGTEKAAALWANGLLRRGHEVHLLALESGPGHGRFADGIPYHEANEAGAVAELLRSLRPDVLHTHQFGWPGPLDVLGPALRTLERRIPVVQTNVFGRLLNPAEDEWVTVRAFVSWTSCVQAAQRSGLPLDDGFFRCATTVSNPLAAQPPSPPAAVAAFRQKLGVADHEILCGKIGRPDLIKWSGLAVDGFLAARRRNPGLKFLVRELPPEVHQTLRPLIEQGVLIPLPMTGDEEELRLTVSSVDLMLHTSKIGESFGYGIAEAMGFGKPVITNCTPRDDQAQVELVRDGETGILASSPRSVGAAILRLAESPDLRRRFGVAAVARIRRIADVEASTDRLEALLTSVAACRGNPFLTEDLAAARQARRNLQANRFGHDWRDATKLRAVTGFFGALRRGRALLRHAGVLRSG